MHNFHGAAAQHVAGAHHQRVAQFVCLDDGFGFGAGGGVRRLAQLQLVQELLEAFAVFGGINHVGAGADDGHACGFKPQSELEWGLPAVLHDNACGLFFGNDFEHVFKGDWLKIEAVRSAVVGGYGFGVAIDHDGFVAVFAHGKRGVYAAVVKLNALPDAVRPATEHHDFFLVGGFGFALFFVGGVQVGNICGKFCRAGIYPFVDGAHAQRVAVRAHSLLAASSELGQAAVREAFFLEGAQRSCIKRSQGCFAFFGNDFV